MHARLIDAPCTDVVLPSESVDGYLGLARTPHQSSAAVVKAGSISGLVMRTKEPKQSASGGCP